MKTILVLVFCLLALKMSYCQFVKSKGINFELQNTPYNFIGCNYWYGGFLYSDIKNKGRKRLKSELNFLKKHGVNNLRVFICAEGDSSYKFRIYPSLQPQQGLYNEDMLIGFDYLLIEAKKRSMKIVFVLNNNWEWSGGMGKYLEWNGYTNPPLPKTNLWDWDNYCNYISKFYSCDSCLYYNNKWIEKIITRKNTLTNKYYYDDETIMAWELANEPRPMKKEAIPFYKTWIQNTSSFIKKLDTNHLVTIGVEGVISTFYDENIFEEIHSYTTIDYATLHLWPKTWQWYNSSSSAAVADTTLLKTKKYIEQHATICKKMNKPLVIEEFGMHRDGNSFSIEATTNNREKYFKYIFETGKQNQIAGYNFWGFAGVKQNTNTNLFMQKGMPYSADPPQEEQGIYSVFKEDKGCWKIIELEKLD